MSKPSKNLGGRPRLSKKGTEVIAISVTKEQAALLKRLADKDGKSLSKFIRDQLFLTAE
jgi:uncharacterized protein (DUF1778 family)